MIVSTMYGWMDGQTDGSMDGLVDGCVDGWMVGWVGGWLPQVARTLMGEGAKKTLKNTHVGANMQKTNP